MTSFSSLLPLLYYYLVCSDKSRLDQKEKIKKEQPTLNTSFKNKSNSKYIFKLKVIIKFQKDIH